LERAEIERLLPEIFQRTLHSGRPLLALLEVMDELHAPSEAALEGIDAIFDPRRTREAFVPMLARWVGLSSLVDERGRAGPATPAVSQLDLGRLRELVAGAATLIAWQGTGLGLRRFLETATGVTGFAIDEQTRGTDGRPRPFHIVVHVPAAAASRRELIDRIVAGEKPAAVTYELVVEVDGEGPAPVTGEVLTEAGR
jgi:phage tail-like protein